MKQHFFLLFLAIGSLLLANEAEGVAQPLKEVSQVVLPAINEPVGFSNSFEGYIPAREIHSPVEPHVELTMEECPSLLDWGLDVILDTSYIYDYDGDYDENTGWMWVAVAPMTDSVVRLYRSTDHGLHWFLVATMGHTPRSLYSQVGLVVGRGDSNWVHVFMRHSINNGDIYLFRWRFDLSAWSHHSVSADADTVDHFTVCRDYRSNYGLYCLHANENRGDVNAKFRRSFDYGKTWDSQGGYNIFDPHISFGPTRFLNLTFVTQGRNIVCYQINRQYGEAGYWMGAINVAFDTFNHYNPKVAQAFTTPDSIATCWLLYEYDWRNTGDMDVWYAVRSNAWGDTWQRGRSYATSSRMDEWAPDIKHYKSLGNIWVNACHIAVDSGYDDSSNVYRQWSDANNPTTWQGRVRVNDSATWAGYWFVGRAGPKVIYSPGAPVAGGGVLYCRAGIFFIPYGLYFDAPWIPTKILEHWQKKRELLRIYPNPTKGEVQISTLFGTEKIDIYNTSGQRIKSFTNPKARVLWNGRDENGQRVGSGAYLIKVKTKETETSEKLLILR